jgi:NDP-sugar pyrophosphorylase family protein
MIKEYFMNFVLHHSDVTIDAAKNSITYHQSYAEPWTITLVDTGETTLTGGRLKRVRNYLDPKEAFCFTYGDGLSDIDMRRPPRSIAATASSPRFRRLGRRDVTALWNLTVRW